MKKGASEALTGAQRTDLDALKALPDDRIDTSDIRSLIDFRQPPNLIASRIIQPLSFHFTNRVYN